MKTQSPRLATLICSLTLTAAAHSEAGDSQGNVSTSYPIQEPSLFTVCELFDFATLYSEKENPIIQEFSLFGRLQADAAFFDADQGKFEQLLWHRFRTGAKARLFEDFILQTEVEYDLNGRDPLYKRITRANLGWSPTGDWTLSAGKLSAGFTLDGATSSTKLIRMERSLLSTNLWFPEEYHTGIDLNGEMNGWIYRVGGYSSAGGNEFSDFGAGYFGLVSLGRDFADAIGIDKALVRLDYVNNDPDENNDGTRSLAQTMSLNGKFEQGKLGIWADVAAGEGYLEQGDLFAVAIMPFYNFTDKWQAVASYNYVTSDRANGVRLDRYESRIEKGRADEVHEFYAGLNYYLCGHKLKWQTGVEYTTASDSANDGGDYDGWGVSTGIRISW